MKAYLALTQNELRLAFRDKQTLFFNFIFPLVFLFFMGVMTHAERGGAMAMLAVTNALVISIMGGGLFGAGIRAVQEREQNILRRFKVAPISPVPILLASITTGLVLFVPTLALVFGVAHNLYALPYPPDAASVLVFLIVGVAAFRAVGQIIAAVANSASESNVLVQLVWLPMLLFGGAMFPMAALPRYLQTFSQFMPSTYLVSGLQGLVVRGESLAANWEAVGSLLLTFAIGVFVASRLFRWEKDEKIKPVAKLWVAGVMAPFIVLGLFQLRTNEESTKNRALWRQLQRDDAFVIKNARIFVGDGKVIESGSVLVRKGTIEAVYGSDDSRVAALKADVVEGSGKTILPGLIDVHVHLGAPGGVYTDPKDYQSPIPERALVQYLYSGVTTVKSVGDELDGSLALRTRIADADLLGAELYSSGPLFTTEGGHGTEYFDWLEGPARAAALSQFVRMPKSAGEAQQQVRELKSAGVDAIKAVLESGRTGILFSRMDLTMFRAVIAEAHAQSLPSSVHTGGARDVQDAVEAGASSIEHGSFSDAIPDAVLARMAKDGVAYDPTLSVLEAMRDIAAGRDELLRRSLVQQALSQKLLTGTASMLKDGKFKSEERVAGVNGAIAIAQDNLRRAWKAGVPLVTGSDAGNMLVFHGPTVHRELQLWVEAGIPPAVALQAATANAAALLRAGGRIGTIAPGREANLLLVDGDPTRDVAATERISLVVFKGERVRRADLFDSAKNPLKP
jgi:imidazolonepropionase-like amidohydrolase/ABC-type multidrug transport system permease subunit